METTLKKPPMFTGKYLFRLIVPLMIEQVLAVTIGFADTIMVARVGESAVYICGVGNRRCSHLFAIFGT